MTDNKQTMHKTNNETTETLLLREPGDGMWGAICPMCEKGKMKPARVLGKLACKTELIECIVVRCHLCRYMSPDYIFEWHSDIGAAK